MGPNRDEHGSSMIQTVVATLIIFLFLVPFILQLLVWPLSESIGLFTAQASAERLRKHPEDPSAAEARGREVAELFRGELFLHDVDLDLRVVSDQQGGRRAEAVMRGQARALLPVAGLGWLAIRGVASGPVEEFRADREAGP
jgi:hypothetical protein